MSSPSLLVLAENWDSSSDYKLLECDEATWRAFDDSVSRKRKRDAAPSQEKAEPEAPPTPSIECVVADRTSALLVTSRSEFTIRRVEYSNTLLLMRDRSTVLEKVPWQYELVAADAKFPLLKRLLREAYLTAEELDGGIVTIPKAKLHTLGSLAAKVCGSPRRIIDALLECHAVMFHNYVRLLHPDLVHNALAALVTQIECHDWPLAAVPVVELRSNLTANFHPIVLDVCLAIFSTCTPSVTEHGEEEECPVVAVSASAVSSHLGERLMHSQDKWLLEPFLAEWRKRLPSFCECDINLLKGHYYMDGAATLVPIVEDTLPLDPLERLKALFSRNKQWDSDSLKALLAPLICIPSATYDQLMSKWCREIHVSGGSKFVLQ